jgi:hypothetical protein
MNPISLVHIHKLFLPSPRNHWSATGPRSKSQPTATRHTQRKHTRHGCWQPKPMRPVFETGQTASVGLSLTHAGETGQTGLANRSGRFFQKLPKNPSERKPASRTSPPLKTLFLFFGLTLQLLSSLFCFHFHLFSLFW